MPITIIVGAVCALSWVVSFGYCLLFFNHIADDVVARTCTKNQKEAKNCGVFHVEFPVMFCTICTTKAMLCMQIFCYHGWLPAEATNWLGRYDLQSPTFIALPGLGVSLLQLLFVDWKPAAANGGELGKRKEDIGNCVELVARDVDDLQ